MNINLPKTLGSFIVIGTVCSATAQDFYDEGKRGPTYFEVDAGGLLVQDFKLTSFGGTFLNSKTSNDAGYRFDIVGGYQFHKNWAVELDLGVTWNEVDKVGGVAVSPDRFDIWQNPLLVNLVYTLPLNGPFSVFVGGGAGGVFTSIDYKLTGFGHIEDTDAAFGYQGMAGVKYEINDSMDIGVTYRLMGTSNHSWSDRGIDITANPILSHAIQAAFRVRF